MHVYLSYDHSDEKYAAALRKELVAQGLNVWNPDSELAPGSNWLMETGRALQRADAIVFILSKRAVRSPYIQKEIDYALTTKRLANRVYPVVVGNDVKVPWILGELGAFKSLTSPKGTATRIVRSIRKPADRPAKRVGARAKAAAAKG